MHALTVQYFEVVQLYRIVSELHRVDRCMFVPLELLDFSGDAGVKTIERWRVVLERAALNRHVQSLLEDDTTAIELMPVVPVRSRFGRVNFAQLIYRNVELSGKAVFHRRFHLNTAEFTVFIAHDKHIVACINFWNGDVPTTKKAF